MGFILLKAQWLTAEGDWNWTGTFWLVRVRAQAPDITTARGRPYGLSLGKIHHGVLGPHPVGVTAPHM